MSQHWDRPWKKAFLLVLTQLPNVSVAAKVAGISRQQAYEHRKTDSAFRAAWEEAVETSFARLEEDALRRARA